MLTGYEMLASHCLPLSKRDSNTSGSPQLRLEGLRDRAVVKMAGNAMSVPCMGAVVCVAVMALDLK